MGVSVVTSRGPDSFFMDVLILYTNLGSTVDGQAHADKVRADLLKDKGINKIVEEFYGLGTQGRG